MPRAGKPRTASRKQASELISDDNRKILGHDRNSSLRCWFMWTPFWTNTRDVNPFETDTKGWLFVVDVSVNWSTDRNWQTKVLDTWKVTQLNLLRHKSVHFCCIAVAPLSGTCRKRLSAATGVRKPGPGKIASWPCILTVSMWQRVSLSRQICL